MSTPDLRAQRPLPAEAQFPSSFRLVLVTGEPLFREGLQSACREARSLLLVETANLSDAIALAKSRLTDMVVIEATTLQQAIEMANAVVPTCAANIPIVAVTESASTYEVKSALAAGLRGCVLKRVEVSELLRILASIGQGSIYQPPEFAAGPLRMRLNGGARDQSRLCRLTPRERQILGCVARALTNRQVARELQLSEKTVKHYMTVIMEKLQVRNRIEAVLKAKPLIDT